MRWTGETITILGALSLLPLIGGLLLWIGGKNLWHAFSSDHWPKTPGVVLDSVAMVDKSTTSGATYYSAKVTFQYEVKGRPYTTQQIRFGQLEGSGDSSDAELTRLMYPPGRMVGVSYSPQNPALAVIEPGFNLQALALPGAALALILPGLMFMLMYIGAQRGETFGAGFLIFPVIFILIGSVLGAAGVSNLWRAWASRNWPRADGVITFGRVDDSRSITRNSEGRKIYSTTFGARIIYTYEVKGQKFYSNVRRFGQFAAADADWAEEIATRYPMGKAVAVAYDPENPSLAVLEPGIGSETWWIPGAGAAFFLFGIAVWVFIALRFR